MPSSRRNHIFHEQIGCFSTQFSIACVLYGSSSERSSRAMGWVTFRGYSPAHFRRKRFSREWEVHSSTWNYTGLNRKEQQEKKLRKCASQALEFLETHSGSKISPALTFQVLYAMCLSKHTLQYYILCYLWLSQNQWQQMAFPPN